MLMAWFGSLACCLLGWLFIWLVVYLIGCSFGRSFICFGLYMVGRWVGGQILFSYLCDLMM